MPTYVQEDYLRALYKLQAEHQRLIKVVELSEKLSLNKSTVAQRLKEMEKQGWVKPRSYGPIELSDLGRVLAQNLNYKHRLIEIFLIEKLGFESEEVHQEAHLLEHALSDKVAQRLGAYLGNPTECPHGQSLPEFKPLESE